LSSPPPAASRRTSSRRGVGAWGRLQECARVSQDSVHMCREAAMSVRGVTRARASLPAPASSSLRPPAQRSHAQPARGSARRAARGSCSNRPRRRASGCVRKRWRPALAVPTCSRGRGPTAGGGAQCLGHTYCGDFHLRGADLRKKGLNRVGNMLVRRPRAPARRAAGRRRQRRAVRARDVWRSRKAEMAGGLEAGTPAAARGRTC
jgi:hypothetical protein